MTNKAVIGNDGLKVVELTTEETKENTAKEKAWIDSKDDRLKQMLRDERQPLLEEADYKINTLVDNNQDASKWRTYRQQLRDITNASDLANATFPNKPS
tara:strand:+ start:328 stop:624 length:297 start_codon:yes stop_codon:yes gene_type:complete